MDLPASLEVVEVGPRDGLQNEAKNVPTGEKVALIEALAVAGLRRFEATNVVAALETGITTFNASVGGLGGSPNAPGAGGDVATEDLAHMLDEMGVQTGIDLRRLMEASDFLKSSGGHPLPARIDRSLLATPGAAR